MSDNSRPQSDAVSVSIDLTRIRKNAEAILRRTGVPLLAVVKADAYGLGAREVAQTIGDLVDGFYVFDEAEAIVDRLWEIAGRRIIALNSRGNADELLAQHIQPVVWSIDRATLLRRARPILSIDTGQQRFACPADLAAQTLLAGNCSEAMTHAVRPDQVQDFLTIASQLPIQNLFLHAAGSALLSEPSAWLNAVRSGLALYEGAVRVSARIIDTRDSNQPAGYTGFISRRFGIILAGYSNGTRRGPCMVNGQGRNILEVGMQSAFVELAPCDRVGDEVVLLADVPGISLPSIASSWNCSQQEVLIRLTGAGKRTYVR